MVKPRAECLSTCCRTPKCLEFLLPGFSGLRRGSGLGRIAVDSSAGASSFAERREYQGKTSGEEATLLNEMGEAGYVDRCSCRDLELTDNLRNLHILVRKIIAGLECINGGPAVALRSPPPHTGHQADLPLLAVALGF